MFNFILNFLFCTAVLTTFASCKKEKETQPLLNATQKSHTNKIQQIRNALKKKISLSEEDRYARELRLILIEIENMHEIENEANAKNLWDSTLLNQEMCSKIRTEFPSITDQEYKKAGNSIGVALLFQKKAPEDEIITILIREAKHLRAAAQIMLEQLYSYPTEGFKPYNPKILNYFKERAEEGAARAKYQYGKILLYGIGVQSNEEAGSKLMEQSKLSEAYMDLAAYYCEDNNNLIKFEHYLRLAATNNDPRGFYNLGILEQHRENYIEAVELFQKTLDVDPTYYNAMLELGRMYAEGWGIEKDIKKGIALMTAVAEQTKNEELRTLAIKNISIINDSVENISESGN